MLGVLDHAVTEIVMSERQFGILCRSNRGETLADYMGRPSTFPICRLGAKHIEYKTRSARYISRFHRGKRNTVTLNLGIIGQQLGRRLVESVQVKAIVSASTARHRNAAKRRLRNKHGSRSTHLKSMLTDASIDAWSRPPGLPAASLAVIEAGKRSLAVKP